MHSYKKKTYFQINKRQTLIDCPCMYYILLYVVHKHQRMYNIQRAREPNLQRLLKTNHLYFSIVIVKLIILNKLFFVWRKSFNHIIDVIGYKCYGLELTDKFEIFGYFCIVSSDFQVYVIFVFFTPIYEILLLFSFFY